MPPVNRNQPQRAKSSASTYSLMEFVDEFPDDAACLDWLWRHLYSEDGQHAECPKCERTRKFHRVAARPSYSCDTCGQHIHPTAGTIFHKSSTSLRHWFHAIFLMSSTRCGISAKQLERELGVTYKTAWRMFRLIRELLLDDEDDALAGDVEVDEMFYGGKPRAGEIAKFKHMTAWERQRAVAKLSQAKKTTVFGMVERGGRVRARVVDDRTKPTLHGIIGEHVLPESMIFSDEWPLYDGLSGKYRGHRRIQHKAKIYVQGNVHTNTIEGFWSLVKRGIGGVHHAVSAKHLQGYLDSYAWRYNHRNDDEPMFKTLLENVRPLGGPGDLSASLVAE